MINDSTPHRVFKIAELARPIAHQLVLISQKSVVNLACVCRCLEEPVLSTLWGTQQSLYTLLKVLPSKNRDTGLDCVVRELDLRSEEPNAKCRVIVVQDLGGSVARSLDQSPALRILDASGQGARLVPPREGRLPQTTPQLTHRWMVPNVAELTLVHQKIQPSLRRPVPFPAPQGDSHFHGTSVEILRCSP